MRTTTIGVLIEYGYLSYHLLLEGCSYLRGIMENLDKQVTSGAGGCCSNGLLFDMME